MIEIDPGFEAYLVEAIARTGIERYRYLSTEHPDPAERTRWQGFVIDLVSGVHVGRRHEVSAAGAPAQGNTTCCG